MKQRWVWAAGLLTWLQAALCAAGQQANLTDMIGRQVTVAVEPDRIVCLGPGALRLIVYLQAQTKVVGVESMEKQNPTGRPYWIAHPELSRLPACGPGGPAGINKKPDLEAVLSVHPQVLFVTYMDRSLADEVQRTLKVPVVVLSYGEFATFDEAVYDALRIAGRVLGREKRADEVVGYLESRRKDLRARTASIQDGEKPGVYVGGIGHRGSQGIESTDRRYLPFDWIGAKNLAGQGVATLGSHVLMDKEALLRQDPDIIFIDGAGMNLVAADFRRKPDFYRSLRAFVHRRVYALLPFNWYTTNIDTALADAYAIGKLLYPGRFTDVDPEKRADEIYTFLVGKPVYQKMKIDFGPIAATAPFFK